MGNRRRLPLELLVFVVGSATLGSEIAVARLIAPFFGDSTIVWANTIAVVPIVAQPLLSPSVDAFVEVSIGGFAGSLFGVLALVSIPVLMLGAVSPWAIRLKLQRVEDSGETAGRMYAISTVGSLLGTRRLEGPLEGGDVYTDDKAPVEWLVDKSLIDYAR